MSQESSEIQGKLFHQGTRAKERYVVPLFLKLAGRLISVYNMILEETIVDHG